MSDLTTQSSPLANVAPLEGGISADEIGVRNLAPSLAILLNPSLYERAKAIAVLMSRAQGITPNWLVGKGEACFSVVTMALDWKLSWHFVARHTYQTPGGSIGFDGALVQSILEASGRFLGSPSFEYRGDWRTIAGKFKMQQSQRGSGSYPVATWTDDDATGLGIIVRWQIKGEPAPRVWPGDDDPFWLVQCQPRNSPLWATDPKTQIRYLAIRRFANMAAPGILGSASFDREEMLEAADLARDITPAREPRREDFTEFRGGPPPVVHDVEEEERSAFEVVALDGEIFRFETLDAAIDAARTVLESARRGGPRMLDAAIENNEAILVVAAEAGTDLVEEFRAEPASSPRARSETSVPGVHQPGPPPGPASPSAEPARAPQSAASPPPPQPTAAAPEPRPAPPLAAAPPSNDDRFPGDLPPGQRLGVGGTAPANPNSSPGVQSSSVPPPTPAPAASATSQGGGGGSAAPTARAGASSPVGPGPTAPTSASPSERASRVVVPPLSRGQNDYRTWVRALMIPKVRQQTSGDDLALLLGDNEAHMQAARSSVSTADMAELDAEIDAAWRRLRP